MTSPSTRIDAKARVPFDLAGAIPTTRTVLEASAGTGKTYSLTGLIARYIAEESVPVDQILVVTFTRAAANELRQRTRDVLIAAAKALLDRKETDKYPWMRVLLEADNLFVADQRRQRLVDAITRFDDLSITTIHGFCQQALGQLGLRSGSDPDVVLIENTGDIVAEVCRDVLVAELADDPTRLSPPVPSSQRLRTPKQVEKDLIEAVQAVLTNPGSRHIPEHSDDETAARWADIVERTHQAVHRRQRSRGQIGYDDLVSGLQRALIDPGRGAVVAAQLAQRFSVVLVDEFQDTDRLQWDVFDTAFGSRALITVGDPKQAIYRFRGADVHAYLDAVAAAPVLSLTTNHRSDQQLLAGLAHLFDGATLGDPRIEFVPVAAVEGAPVNALGHIDASIRPAAPIQLRVAPQVASLRTAKYKTLSMPLIRPLVLADLANRTIDLLDNGFIRDRSGGRPVEPGDIAVLVPSHAEAHHVADALHRAGIPAVRTRTGSVLQSSAVMQWRLLLTAMARPHDPPSVRTAALGWFLATDIADLAGDNADAVLGELQQRAAEMADQLRRSGLAAFYDAQKSGRGLLEAVLAQSDGDRHLTDLDHLAEVLTQALHGTTSDASRTLRVLEELVANDDERSESTMRRIDSDALAVQITTIHAAKGLEYPIVLVPFSFKPRPPTRTPYSFTDEHGRRVLDVASSVAWDAGLGTDGDETTRQNRDLRKHLAGVENDGDSLRLLYVALTRAQHHLELWWASTTGAKTSALGRMLLDRDGSGPVDNTESLLKAKKKPPGFAVVKPGFAMLGEEAVREQIELLVDASAGAIEITELAAQIEHPSWFAPSKPQITELTTASVGGHASVGGRASVADHAWKRWSFTRLSASADELEPFAEPGGNDDGGASDAPVVGGADEPEASADGHLDRITDGITAGITAGMTATASRPGDGWLASSAAVVHLADVAAGTAFGTFVHSVLEQLDFTADDLAGEIRTLAVEHARAAGLALDIDRVVSGLVAAAQTPLGPLFGERSLADIPPADRLAELTFDIPIVGGAAFTRLRAGAIGDVLSGTLAPDDPLRSYADRLATELAGVDIAGWMHGSIDAVFRVPAAHGHRYIVVDYKTNRLHTPGDGDPLAAYQAHHLLTAMEHHRYPLQALLYSVALHRYLRWRLGAGYSPDEHLGGIAYLFVRGMVGPSTPTAAGVPNGVFSWTPPTTTILELDHLFATGSPS